MKWGIIGLDFIAEEFMEKLNQLQAPYVVACEDTLQREMFQIKHKEIVCYEIIKELLLDSEVKVVYISSYLHEHKRQIHAALTYGKHVFCEKPMFANAQDAKEAFELARQKKLFLGEANTMFYMPLHHELQKHMDQIGKLKMIRAEFGSLKEENKDAAIYRKDMGGGALYDIGIYALTAVLMYLKGTIASVECFQKPHPYGVDERWLIMLKTDKQELAVIALSLRSKLDKRLILAGDKAYYEIMNYPRADQGNLVYPDMSKKLIQNGNTKEAVCYEILEVERCIQDNDVTNETMKITIQAMECMDQLKGVWL